MAKLETRDGSKRTKTQKKRKIRDPMADSGNVFLIEERKYLRKGKRCIVICRLVSWVYSTYKAILHYLYGIHNVAKISLLQSNRWQQFLVKRSYYQCLLWTSNYLQNITHKTKDRVIRTPLRNRLWAKMPLF